MVDTTLPSPHPRSLGSLSDSGPGAVSPLQTLATPEQLLGKAPPGQLLKTFVSYADAEEDAWLIPPTSMLRGMHSETQAAPSCAL